MNTKPQKSYTVPIIMMILLFGMIAFVTNLAAPMGIVVKGQFHASNFLGMLGNFANFIAYAIMGIPAGKLLEKIGYKKTALIAIAVGFVGVAVQFLSGQVASFLVYLIGALISGFAMCMLNTVVNPMLNTLGGGGKKGNQLIQIGGAFNSLMGTLVPILVGMLVGEVTKNTAIKDVNPVLFMAMGIFALVGIVLTFVKIPEPNIERRAKSTEKSKYSPWSFRHFVLGAIAIFVYVGIEVGIPGTTNLFMTTYTIENAQQVASEYSRQQADPTYLASLQAMDDANSEVKDYESKVIQKSSFDNAQEVINGKIKPGLGMKASVAGFIIGLYFILMLVGRLVGASLGAKYSSKAMLIFVSTLGAIFILAALLLPASIGINITSLIGAAHPVIVPVSVILFILCGLCTSIMWGGIFNLAVEGLGKYTEAATGIFMVMVCGGGILPLIQNFVADKLGFMMSYWVPLLGLAYLLYYALVGSKNVNKSIPVE